MTRRVADSAADTAPRLTQPQHRYAILRKLRGMLHYEEPSVSVGLGWKADIREVEAKCAYVLTG